MICARFARRQLPCLVLASSFYFVSACGDARPTGLKLFQKPDVVFVKEADVVDAVTNHGDALDAEAECPAGPDFGVVADVLKHLRMHHAAPGDFQPVLAQLLHERIAEINLETRLSIAEIVRTETNLHVLDRKSTR